MFDKLKRQMTSDSLTPRRALSILIFGSIILVFVFFGLPSSNDQQGTGSVARVNNTLISVADLRNEAQRLEQMYAPLFGGQMPGDTQRQFLRGQAAENLISMELMAQTAKKEGILATNAEVRDFIVKEIDIFQKDGRFQRDLYERYLEYAKTSAGEFEEKIRKDRKNQRVQRLMALAATPLQLEVQKQKDLRETKLNLAFAKIDKDQWVAKGSVAEVELKAKLANPEFAKRVGEYFASHKSEFQSEAQVHAQHILIKAEPGNEASEKAALEKIQGLKARAQKEDFAKLAKEFSEDGGSKANGGDLGFFGKGKMVPEFETAAFQQKTGEVGEPVKSNFGYHLIKVLEKKTPEEPVLAKFESEIAKKLVLTEKIDADLKTLEEALAQGNSAGVDQGLKALGVSFDETGFFDLNAESIPKINSPVASQAMGELSEAKPLLGRLVRDGNLKYVLKLKATKKESSGDTKTLVASLSRERSGEMLNQWLEKAKKSSRIEKNTQVIQGR
jgi:parvulin-like peptidyl-prolyl isomerase